MLDEQIVRTVREWPQWSPAERRRIDSITDEVLEHCRTGNGNAFIADWCARFIARTSSRFIRIGQRIQYSNDMGQTFDAVLARQCANENGKTFLIVKRDEWPTEEVLAVADFNNGTYTLLS